MNTLIVQLFQSRDTEETPARIAEKSPARSDP
jgi:hypothetical protein